MELSRGKPTTGRHTHERVREGKHGNREVVGKICGKKKQGWGPNEVWGFLGRVQLHAETRKLPGFGWKEGRCRQLKAPWPGGACGRRSRKVQKRMGMTAEIRVTR